MGSIADPEQNPGDRLAEAKGQSDEVPGSWFSTKIYDPILWLAERAGMSDRRHDLVGRAHGSVLEIGAGTGLNLDHYPSGLDRLVVCEPDLHMAKRLESRLSDLGREAEVVRATGELLPFKDDSFDSVVSTLVLCTVGDPEQTLGEIRRILRPDGSLLFIEHVRSDQPRLARWQDRLRGPWESFADGCQCNRDTSGLLQKSGYSVEISERAKWRRMPPIVRPLIVGEATPGN